MEDDMKKLILLVVVFVVLIGCSVNRPVITYGNSLSYEQYQARAKETRNITISFTGHPSSYLRVRSNNIKIPVTLGYESLDICIPNGETVRIDSLKQGDIKFKLERIKPVYTEIETTNEHTKRARKREREKEDEKECTIHIGIDGNETNIQKNYDFGSQFSNQREVKKKNNSFFDEKEYQERIRREYEQERKKKK
jgi:hypothetical protein